MSAVLVSLCVNNPDNGMPTGRVCGVHIHESNDIIDGTIELETGYLYDRDNPTFDLINGSADWKMRVGRHVYPITGYRQSYGNWCWDAVRMTSHQAKRLVRNLVARGFQISAGPEDSEYFASPETQVAAP